ncbi:MAG: DUF4867 family protein [Synergistales bacterium]|nr:DUF4867 family protein [Synergistales bacterium]MDY6405148.1 DUF4867 family protein [Synergistales bacterium]MDY6410605.1 DUF4867 family protein [Synergistales bacterium]MDY6414856.1 DUF4867 family protein [Synergistales bacterium]MDY6425346.1 DUF4867 family protein [Synergistales bacterium]
MKLYNAKDIEFKPYGRIIDGYDFSELISVLKTSTPCPDNGTVYVTSDEKLERLDAAKVLGANIYGRMPIEIGYCNGHNTKLNALEYHRDSEVNIAADDVILLLAKKEEINDGHSLDTSKVKAFLIPAGTAVEIYATSLHYAPCHVKDGGFRVAVVLPRGTNEALNTKTEILFPEDKLLTHVNKWLIAHPDGGCPEGSFIGLTGKNIDTATDIN